MRLEHRARGQATPGSEASRHGTAATERAALPTLRLGPSQILVLSVWFGLLAAFCEIAVVWFGICCGADPFAEWPELLWMAPVADILLLVVPGIFLACGAWLRPGVGSLRLVAFVYLSFVFACLLFHIPGLSGYARVLLALGLSMEASRIVVRYPQLLGRLIDWTTRWARLLVGQYGSRGAAPAAGLAGAANANDLVKRRQMLVSSTIAVTGLAATVSGRGWLRERRALAALPPAKPGRPNVLFLVLDTVRAQSLSLYGYGRPTTPNLERLARQGVTFQRAIVSAPWTLPSHATMFTGRWLSDTGINTDIPLDARYPTLAEMLTAQGYLTAAFVGNTGFLCPAYGLLRGFAHYDCLRPTIGQVLRASALAKGFSSNPKIQELSGYYQTLGRKTAADVNEGLLEWLKRKDNDNPFFAFVNYFDAHYPYIPSSEAVGQFGLRAPKKPVIDFYHTYTADEIEALQGVYDQCILGIDAEVGRLMERLKVRGHLENTVVIVTSDHGEHFGEHGLMEHACSLYTQLLHVPFIILHPSRAPAGKLVAQPVSLRDLPATILDLIGLGQQGALPGESLTRCWEGGRAAREGQDVPVLSELYPLHRPSALGPVDKGPMKSLVWREFHYIRNGDGFEELYNIEADPPEENNLAKSPTAQAVLEKMRARLAAVPLS